MGLARLQMSTMDCNRSPYSSEYHNTFRSFIDFQQFFERSTLASIIR